MNTTEVAKKLFDLCNKGDFLKAIDETYAKDIVSIEPMSMPGAPAEMSGFDSVRGKSVWWMDNHEVHSCVVTGPFVNGDRFVVGFNIDVTNKPSKKRMQMNEVGVYTVANGKIVREEFFYGV